VDTDLHYPEDLNGKVHHDGQIWSRALWDICLSLGHVQADTVILEAQFDFAPDTTMPAAAAATVAAAETLYGSVAAAAVRGAFAARGIL
jgi:Zn-dependent metalloprotease